MLEQIIQFLEYCHWRRNDELSAEFPVYILTEGKSKHGILLIDGDKAHDLTKERYHELMDGIAQEIPVSGPDDIPVMAFFVTSEFAKYALLADGTRFWIITPNGRIIVRTGQPEDYCGMREELHKSIAGEAEANTRTIMKDPEGKDIIRYQTLHSYQDTGFLSDCADSFITCYFTLIFFAINVLVFVIPYSMNGDSGIRTLSDAFGSSWDKTISEGQIWRAFTCMFVHLNTTHLVSNMFALLIIGYFIERRISRKMFISVYLGGGLIGSFVSLLYHYAIYDPSAPSMFRDSSLYGYLTRVYSKSIICAGASGAIMALAGACAFRLTIGRVMDGYWKADPHPYMDYLVILSCISNLGTAFFVDSDSQQGVDVSAHIGGAIGGFLVMGLFLFLMYLREQRQSYNLN